MQSENIAKIYQNTMRQVHCSQALKEEILFLYSIMTILKVRRM